MRFAPGATLVTREVWRGEVWAVRPMLCLGDTDHLALWFPSGTPWLHPARLGGGRIRVPTEPWELVEARWHLNDNLIILRDGDAHAVHLFFAPDGTHKGWYVNLQEPLRRTSLGFDYFDHALDLVAPADLSEISWKDEDDLADLATLVGPDAAAEIRAEGERVAGRMRERAWPFDGSFSLFHPDSSWARPILDEPWRTIPAT